MLAAIFGYFLGSIPFGLLITRAAGLGDIRSIGSGNIGTTNVLRTGRKELAAATLLLDMAKATAAVLIAGQWGELAGLIAGAAAFFGHLFPLWLRFKGGKGVATYLGALLGAAPLAALAFAIIWIAVAALSRYSSLSALTASLLAPAAVYVSGAGLAATIVFALLTVALWIAHRQNIARLSAGTESRIGAK
ncbi:MAG: glycerol-3-phosphate 1-O-acyltransferase PlsY [Alphaproteobacteria bacterium]|nr:glycerol-3-phosphate 1-O-acyltransferase PlsY [Alphaproteobacteria bacterium]